MRRILSEPKNSLVKQYIEIFRLDGVTLQFEDDALDYVVNNALEYKLGARGLRSIMESIMMTAMYETPSMRKKKLIITREYAEQEFDKKKSKLA